MAAGARELRRDSKIARADPELAKGSRREGGEGDLTAVTARASCRRERWCAPSATAPSTPAWPPSGGGSRPTAGPLPDPRAAARPPHRYAGPDRPSGRPSSDLPYSNL